MSLQIEEREYFRYLSIPSKSANIYAIESIETRPLKIFKLPVQLDDVIKIPKLK